MRKLLLSLCAALVTLPGLADAPAPAQLTPVAPAALAQRLGDPALVVLDVRTAEEFASGHVPGAINIPHMAIVSRKADLDADKEHVFICEVGSRSALACEFAAALGFRLVGYLPPAAVEWTALNLKNAVVINAILAVFNLFPLPPLDGGRIAVGLLPNVLAYRLARLEPYGMAILIGLIIVLPLLGTQFGIDLGFVSHAISAATGAVIRVIMQTTANI